MFQYFDILFLLWSISSDWPQGFSPLHPTHQWQPGKGVSPRVDPLSQLHLRGEQTPGPRLGASLEGARTPAPGAVHCWPVRPQETLKYSSVSVSALIIIIISWCAQGIFEHSENLWQVWSLILNAISPLLLSPWGFSFSLGCGISLWWVPTFSCRWLFSGELQFWDSRRRRWAQSDTPKYDWISMPILSQEAPQM